MANNILIHEIGKETKIVVMEGAKVPSNDFFSAQYHNALSITESIVRNQENYDPKTGQVENFSNIISFIGDRGSGKTSCMLTFANILEAQNDDKFKTSVFKSTELSQYGFYLLPTIDPSFFAQKYNIIGAFIASIYNQFQDLTSNNRNNSDEGLIQDFYNVLAKAQRSFGKTFAEGKSDTEDMERLEQMSSTLKLKDDIKKLVDRFLCYVSNNNDCHRKSTKLVLCIDDIDLNTDTAVEMMEWIRKYLIQPNLIILFAIKLDQMVDLKRMKLYAEYKDFLYLEKETRTRKDHDVNDMKLGIDDMVEKYIAKIIPLKHRVLMPDFEDVSNIKYYKLTADEAKEIESKKKEKKEERDLPWLRDAVVERIFQKTRYLFYNQATSTSFIVPRNLREVLHLMSMLETMPEIDGTTTADGKNNEKREQTLRPNQHLFKEYVFNDCTYKYLTSDSRQLIDELLEVTEAKYFNSKVLYILKKKFGINNISDVKDDNEEDTNEIPLSQITKAVKAILSEENIAYNISTGDVLWILNWLSEMQRTKEELYFLFIVRFIYSIKMYECYDRMFTIDLKEISKGEEEGKIAYLRPKKELKEVSEYQQLIAGQLFNSSLVNFIPEGTVKWFSDGIIDWVELKTNIFKDGNVKADDYRLIEFLMLCTSGPNVNHDTVRRRSIVPYSYMFGAKTRKTVFDLYSFFYNIIDIRSCYNQFRNLLGTEKNEKGEDIYITNKILSDNERTLWADFYRVALNTHIWNIAKEQTAYSGLRGYEYKDKKEPDEQKMELNLERFLHKLEERKNVYEILRKDGEENVKLRIDSKDWSHLWLSWCCIRNAEVYQDFVNYLEGNRYESAGDFFKDKIYKFFKTVFYYNQATHDFKDEGNNTHYKLNFAYVGVLLDLIDSLDEKVVTKYVKPRDGNKTKRVITITKQQLDKIFEDVASGHSIPKEEVIRIINNLTGIDNETKKQIIQAVKTSSKSGFAKTTFIDALNNLK